MKDLKCGLKSCVHNKGYCCCAKQVNVDRQTDCLTYEYDETKANTDFEVGSDFIPANYSVDTKVSCSADCIFNRDNRCISNGITVMGQGENQAACLTFIKD